LLHIQDGAMCSFDLPVSRRQLMGANQGTNPKVFRAADHRAMSTQEHWNKKQALFLGKRCGRQSDGNVQPD
jgi:hypothetical protein